MSLRHAPPAIVQGFTSFLILGWRDIDTGGKCKIYKIDTQGMALVVLYWVSQAILSQGHPWGRSLNLAVSGARPLEPTMISFSGVFLSGPWR
jgi:hypothetical protein